MLWMTRTPLRVSLFGGGTDYPEYFHRKPGAVVGFAIDKYIHIAALRLNAFQPYNYRVAYSQLEQVNTVEEIEHPVVREVLKHFNIRDRLDLSIMSDLPASGSGLGSSSAFTVGFVKLLHALQGRTTTKIDVARTAVMVERELLAENVGVQDQLHAAFGGINRFDFHGPQIRITPIQVSGALLEALSDHLVLVHTGVGRRATAAVAAQLEATRAETIDKDLSELYALVGECVRLLEGRDGDVLPELGRMLSESWFIKRGLSDRVTNDTVDAVFEAVQAHGAYGAKLCGAGGGGFFLALVPPERQAALAAAVAPLAVIPIDVDVEGTTVIYPASAPGTGRPLVGC
jgi:D-glycero-alpha-D-manno-heptose-7-phosphate kinase